MSMPASQFPFDPGLAASAEDEPLMCAGCGSVILPLHLDRPIPGEPLGIEGVRWVSGREAVDAREVCLHCHRRIPQARPVGVRR